MVYFSISLIHKHHCAYKWPDSHQDQAPRIPPGSFPSRPFSAHLRAPTLGARHSRAPSAGSLSLPYCRLLSRSNTLTVACSHAAMHKHINTCAWCERPPVRRMDARTHVTVIKATTDRVAACHHKTKWSTVMCVTCALLQQCTHSHIRTCSPMCLVTFLCIPPRL